MEETTIETIAGSPEDEYWSGGREGHFVYEDDWVPDRSWFFSCRVLKSSEYGLNIYVKLWVGGSSEGRCVPEHARAWLCFGYDKDDWTKPKIQLGSRDLRTLKTAKLWARSLATPAVIKDLYQQFYSPSGSHGVLIEKFDKDLGWHPWLWSFEHYFDQDLSWGDYRTTDRGRVSLIKRGSYSWSSKFWPSIWDRISNRGEEWGRRGSKLQDEYGDL